MNVILYMLANDVDSDITTINILNETDNDCEMARISVEGMSIMEGNFWDFHNGCHGINEFGHFDHRYELIGRLTQLYKDMGFIVNLSASTPS